MPPEACMPRATVYCRAKSRFSPTCRRNLRKAHLQMPGTLPVIMRFSTNPGDILIDNVSTPRGLGLKIIGVEGARLPGAKGQVPQDFVMQNAPAFTAPTPKAFLRSLKMLAGTTDKMPDTKRALSAVLRGLEASIEALGGESPTLKSLGGHPKTNLLGETYSTVVPLLVGTYCGKVTVVPVAETLTALTHAKVDLAGKPDGLRESVNEFFGTNGGEWEVRVQLATDIECVRDMAGGSQSARYGRKDPDRCAARMVASALGRRE
jgi:hypothetical protein